MNNKLVSHCAVCSDAAMSSGASVLVHCAAGISRSPALAVAYIMYSLGMDLDQAYRYCCWSSAVLSLIIFVSVIKRVVQDFYFDPSV